MPTPTPTPTVRTRSLCGSGFAEYPPGMVPGDFVLDHCNAVTPLGVRCIFLSSVGMIVHSTVQGQLSHGYIALPAPHTRGTYIRTMIHGINHAPLPCPAPRAWCSSVASAAQLCPGCCASCRCPAPAAPPGCGSRWRRSRSLGLCMVASGQGAIASDTDWRQLRVKINDAFLSTA